MQNHETLLDGALMIVECELMMIALLLLRVLRVCLGPHPCCDGAVMADNQQLTMSGDIYLSTLSCCDACKDRCSMSPNPML